MQFQSPESFASFLDGPGEDGVVLEGAVELKKRGPLPIWKPRYAILLKNGDFVLAESRATARTSAPLEVIQSKFASGTSDPTRWKMIPKEREFCFRVPKEEVAGGAPSAMSWLYAMNGIATQRSQRAAAVAEAAAAARPPRMSEPVVRPRTFSKGSTLEHRFSTPAATVQADRERRGSTVVPYEVQKNDTVESIALAYGMTPSTFLVKNGHRPGTRLLPGQVVLVPSDSPRATSVVCTPRMRNGSYTRATHGAGATATYLAPSIEGLGAPYVPYVSPKKDPPSPGLGQRSHPDMRRSFDEEAHRRESPAQVIRKDMDRRRASEELLSGTSEGRRSSDRVLDIPALHV